MNLTTIKGHKGRIGHCQHGAWHRRMLVAAGMVHYQLHHPCYGKTQLADFAWIAGYNAELRAYNQLRLQL